MEKKINLKPIFTLIVIVPFLTEILSGNMTLAQVLLPPTFILLVIIYGVAALLIRELSVKWKLGVEGLFLLGLAYGILNEGICAKTLLMAENVPLKEFYGHYPLRGGINIAWSIMILTWHALHSVLYPILIVHFLFPKHAHSSWLNRSSTIFLSLIVTAAGVLMFFNTPRFQAPTFYLPVFAITMFLLTMISKYLPKTTIPQNPGKTSFAFFFMGTGFFSYIFGSIFLAVFKTHEFFLLGFILLVLITFYFLIKKNKNFSLTNIILFILGNYTADIFFLFLGGLVNHSLQRLYTAIVFFIIAIISTSKIAKTPNA